MIPAPYELLGQLAINTAILWVVARNFQSDKVLLWLVFLGYLTVPVAIVFSGINSAVYVYDLSPLVVAVGAWVRGFRPFARALTEPITRLLFAFLILLPMINTAVLAFAGAYRIGLIDVIHYVRSLSLFMLFVYGYASSSSSKTAGEFIAAHGWFAIPLVAIGILHYFTPLSVPVFERIMAGGSLPRWHSDVGTGFMGLFRGAIGQLVASVALLVAGWGGTAQWFGIVLLALGGVNIFMSGSRAGLLGLAGGLVVLAVLKVRGSKGAPLGVLARPVVWLGILATLAVVLGLVSGQDVVDLPVRRVQAMFSFLGSGETTDGSITVRVDTWRRALGLLSTSKYAWLVGYALANTALLNESIGLWGAHNEYVDIWVRFGTPAFVLYVLFLTTMALTWVRALKGSDKHAAIGQLGIVLLAANMVMAGTQMHLLYSHAVYPVAYFLYLTYGVLLGAVRDASPRPPHAPSVVPSNRSSVERSIEYGEKR